MPSVQTVLITDPFQHGWLYSGRWQKCTKDYGCKFPALDTRMAEYQKPAKVDKMMKIQGDLDETKVILVRHSTCARVLVVIMYYSLGLLMCVCMCVCVCFVCVLCVFARARWCVCMCARMRHTNPDTNH